MILAKAGRQSYVINENNMIILSLPEHSYSVWTIEEQIRNHFNLHPVNKISSQIV